MTHRPSRPLPFRPLLVVAVLLLVASGVRAEVNDSAGFFSQNALQQANQTLNQLRRDTGKEMLVETLVQPPAGMNGDNLSQSFPKWAQRKAQENHVDGIYVLICKNPGEIAVSAGNSTVSAGDFPQQDIGRLRRTMQAAFKQKDFDGGLQQGVAFVDQTFRANAGGSNRSSQAAPAIGSAGASSTPRQTDSTGASPGASPVPGGPIDGPSGRSAPTSGGFGWMTWLIIGVIGIGVIYFLLKMFTNRGGGASRVAPNASGGYSGSGLGGVGGVNRGGGGMGGGLLGGLLGGVAGNLLGGRLFGGGGRSSDDRSAPPASAPPASSSGSASSGGGMFDESSDVDTSFTDANTSVGSFDSGGSSDLGGSADAGGGASDFSSENTSSGSF